MRLLLYKNADLACGMDFLRIAKIEKGLPRVRGQRLSTAVAHGLVRAFDKLYSSTTPSPTYVLDGPWDQGEGVGDENDVDVPQDEEGEKEDAFPDDQPRKGTGNSVLGRKGRDLAAGVLVKRANKTPGGSSFWNEGLAEGEGSAMWGGVGPAGGDAVDGEQLGSDGPGYNTTLGPFWRPPLPADINGAADHGEHAM